MVKRRPVDPQVEMQVILKGARRCCLCFHLDNDFEEKVGQIAHLDRDPSNGSEDNLAFLCMRHHTLYDSTTSQHKNYTIAEVKAARARLYAHVERNREPSASEPRADVPLGDELDIDLQSFGSSQKLTHFIDGDYPREGVFVACPNVVLTNRSSRDMGLMVSMHIPLLDTNPSGRVELVARTERGDLLGIVQKHLHGYAMQEMLIEPIRIAAGQMANGVLVFCVRQGDLELLNGELDRYQRGEWYLRFEDKLSNRTLQFSLERIYGVGR